MAHLQQLPDGTWHDTRYRFARGDRISIMRGPFEGRIATVSSRVGQMKVDGHLVPMAGYQVTLVDGRWVTVKWDEVDPL